MKLKMSCCILAAGQGTRMKSGLPKVLHTISDRPLISYIIEAVRNCQIENIFVVLGHQIHSVKEYLPRDVKIIEQPELLGTGDAVKRVIEHNATLQGHLMVLCGDAPLIRPQTLKKLMAIHEQKELDCTLLTARLEDPTGYGRILRDKTGRIERVVEEKETSAGEQVIKEVNSGSYIFRVELLIEALQEIQPHPEHNGEYYLTDVISVFSKKGFKMDSVTCPEPEEIMGINSRRDLARAQSIIWQRNVNYFLDRGVTILDPHTTYINGQVEIGPDTIIYPLTFIETEVRVGRSCRIGPNARLGRGCIIEDRVIIGDSVRIEEGKIIKEGVKVNGIS